MTLIRLIAALRAFLFNLFELVIAGLILLALNVLDFPRAFRKYIKRIILNRYGLKSSGPIVYIESDNCEDYGKRGYIDFADNHGILHRANFLVCFHFPPIEMYQALDSIYQLDAEYGVVYLRWLPSINQISFPKVKLDGTVVYD